MGDQFFGFLNLNWELALDKLHQSHRMCSLLEEEVEPITNIFNHHCLIMSPVFEENLLKEEEGFLVVDFLSDLDYSVEWVVGVFGCAVWTLLIVNNKLSYKRLLNINILGNLF
jgi:hypothetical protein